MNRKPCNSALPTALQNETGMNPERAYTPPPLNALEAQFLNVLLTRDWPPGFELFGKPLSFAADPWQAPFAPACGVRLNVRGETWQMLCSSRTLLGLHPAGICLAEASDLPEGLRLALVELSLAPVLRLLADVFSLDTPPAVVDECLEISGDFACSVPLTLRLPDETIAVSLHIPSHAAAEAALRRLAQVQRIYNPASALCLSVALEVGTMRLSLAELSSLQVEYILLPESFALNQNQLCIRLSPEMGVRCALDNGHATVLGVEHGLPGPAEKETRRETMADPLSDATPGKEAAAPESPANGANAPENALNLGGLEVAVSFELDRRLMSLADIAALKPGYTFALPASPDSPVTIRANGKALGTGRLVDMGGVLGVQLVSLEQGK